MLCFVCGNCNETLENRQQVDKHGFTCLSAPPALKSHLLRLGSLENIPRDSKKRFQKLARQHLNLHKGDTVVEEMWSFLQSCHVKEQGELATTVTVPSTSSMIPTSAEGNHAIDKEQNAIQAEQKTARKEKKRNYKASLGESSAITSITTDSRHKSDDDDNMRRYEISREFQNRKRAHHIQVQKQPACKASLERLLLDCNLSETSLCPICLERENIYCRVLNHPRRLLPLLPANNNPVEVDVAHQRTVVTEIGNRAIFPKPEQSASAIADSTLSPHIYDVFAQVCGVGSYLPNKRLQKLVDRPPFDHNEIIKFRNRYVYDLLDMDTFRNVPQQEDETGEVAEQNLRVILRAMSSHCNRDLIFKGKKSFPSRKVYLAASITTPKDCLTVSVSISADEADHKKKVVVIGSEANEYDTSLRLCYSQLISVCGSSCIELHRLGLKREACVVLGIAMAGAYCQFCAVYLIEDNFPAFVTLTPPLGLFDTLDIQYRIADWCLKVIEFGQETKSKLCRTELERTSRRNQSAPVPSTASVRVTLNLNGYFAKLIHKAWPSTMNDNNDDNNHDSILTYSKRNIRLNYLMRVYEHLRGRGKLTTQQPAIDENTSSEGANLILFPTGVVSIPGDKDIEGCEVTHTAPLRQLLISHCHKNGFTGINLNCCPVVLFPLLPVSQGWYNNQRSPTITLRKSYLKQLRIACNWLNEKKVAHLDLRPANIMWRVRQEPSSSEELQLYLIDFEDAVMFDDGIPTGCIETVLRTMDKRYPFVTGDETRRLVAQSYHNEFFYEAIVQWISSDLSFTFFMDSNKHCEIMNRVLCHSGSSNIGYNQERRQKHKKPNRESKQS